MHLYSPVSAAATSSSRCSNRPELPLGAQRAEEADLGRRLVFVRVVDSVPAPACRVRIRNHVAFRADQLVHGWSVNSHPQGARRALVWSYSGDPCVADRVRDRETESSP